MTDRERLLAILNYEQPDEPLPMQWMGFSEATLQRWRREGMPEDTSPYEYFGLKRARGLPVTVFPYPVRENILLEQGETYRIVLDNRDLKVRHDDNAPQFYVDCLRETWRKLLHG